MTELIHLLARLWTLENETEIDRHGHKAVKYVVRQLWPDMAAALDKCAEKVLLLDNALKRQE